MRSFNEIPSLRRIASDESSLIRVAAIVNSGSSEAGTSLRLCTAMSASQFKRAVSSLETNNPFPPIRCKGASVKSPSDSMETISHLHEGSLDSI